MLDLLFFVLVADVGPVKSPFPPHTLLFLLSSLFSACAGHKPLALRVDSWLYVPLHTSPFWREHAQPTQLRLVVGWLPTINIHCYDIILNIIYSTTTTGSKRRLCARYRPFPGALAVLCSQSALCRMACAAAVVAVGLTNPPNAHGNAMST